MKLPCERISSSEAQTAEIGRELARELFVSRPAFVRLKGGLGAGKTALARGFIAEWLKLAGEPEPESITSPTFNIARVYGSKTRLAHLDLYRVKTLAELEQLGFEHYFFEHSCCVVEWLEQVPEALASLSSTAVTVELEAGDKPGSRVIRLRS